MTAGVAAEAAPAASVPSDPVMSLRGIRKRFGAHEVLRDIDLDLYCGECLGVLGDNAAGKSTLMKVMSGAYIPDDGRILMQGQPVRFEGPADARARRIEMVYQDLSLCDTIDVAGNMFLGREIVRGGLLAKAEMQRHAHEMLEALDIRIRDLSMRVANLSGGQRQSIAIARAASFDPLVLIMDEPTSALAVAEVEAVLGLIRRLKAQGRAVVLITHRLQDVFRVCDRLAVMYEGRKVAERRIGETNLQELVTLITTGAPS